ncbi:glycosyltransferase [Flavobacterium psychrotolerans]|uniref:Glycosyltransferase 2-like domain-containing protein n=1 Tax=Flavobacterium psychrotolerans TaxID=2169410 RepID=A0A2U1JI98_9FLAO|nr:glycosyltransferase [Flavobacterium psychrotolerans]PWA04861.1 hypothetical protein DB895_08830 [Flavobacterium psychrotolerans]
MYNGISIVICTYNGSKRLPETLSCICNLMFLSPYELILVDNASKDDTIQVVKNNLQGSDLDWRIVNESNPGLSNARWKGVFEAKYDIVLFCDDDNYLASDYLEIGFKYFNENPKIGVLGGLGSPVFEADKPDWFENFSHSYAVGTLGKTNGVQNGLSYHYGAACFFLKGALLQLPGIGFKSALSDRKGDSLSSGGDVELCYVVQLLGYDLYYTDNLHFKHFIEKHRLDRAYYLRLKAGISASFPLLTAYEINNFKNRTQYKKYLFKLFFRCVQLYFYVSCKKVLFSKNENLDISIVVNKSKIKAFLKNYNRSVKHFSYVKSIFKI